MMDMPVVSTSWFKSNISYEEWWVGINQGIEKGLTIKIARVGIIWLSFSKYIFFIKVQFIPLVFLMNCIFCLDYNPLLLFCTMDILNSSMQFMNTMSFELTYHRSNL